jgi:hypothetical protein
MGSVLQTIYACKLRPYGVDLITFKKITIIEKGRKKERKNKRNRRRKKKRKRIRKRKKE